MTWSNVVATGAGGSGIEYRLVIEGAPFEFCTSAEMAGACGESGQDGKRRVPGLMRSGLGFSENAYLAGAELDISINAITIAETGYPELDAATAAFSSIPDRVAYLNGVVSSATTSITVHSDAAVIVGNHYHLAREVVKVTAKASNVLTVERGKWRTTAQQHHATTLAGAPSVRSLRDGPQIWRRRRVWLYAHGVSELGLSDTGTLIYRGILAEEPQLADSDAVAWTLSLESRWSLLAQEVATGFDKPRRIRGIYYPGDAPFFIRLVRSTNTLFAFTTDQITVTLVGFYESNQAFATALASACNTVATTAGWAPGVQFFCEEAGGRWHLGVTMANPARYIYATSTSGSYVDGNGGESLVPSTDPLKSDGLATLTAENDKSYYLSWGRLDRQNMVTPGWPSGADLRTVPRSVNVAAEIRGTDTQIAFNPVNRFYLDSVAGLQVSDVLLVTRAPPFDTLPAIQCAISLIDTVAGWVEIGLVIGGFEGGFTQAGELVRDFGLATDYGTTDLAGFRDQLVARAPDNSNTGATPWVLADDLASWTAQVAQSANGRASLTKRKFRFFKGVKVDEIVKQEARLLSCFFYLDADFKIALRPLTLDTAAVPGFRQLNDTSRLIDTGFGTLESSSDGYVNTVEISRGYDPVEDKHTGQPVTVTYVEGVSDEGKRSVLEIKPKTTPEVEIDTAQALEIASSVVGLFGGRILFYTIDVPLTLWPTLIGDAVIVTAPELPYDGARTVHDSALGMRSARAIVVGRSWDLDEGRGTLTLLFTGLDVDSGYSPTCWITAASGATTTWTLTVDASRFGPVGGPNDSSYFVIGDRIRLVQWDPTGAITTRAGAVTSVGATTVGVLLDASWAGLGGFNYLLTYDTAANCLANQFAYAFVASSALTYSKLGGTANARGFLP